MEDAHDRFRERLAFAATVAMARKELSRRTAAVDVGLAYPTFRRVLAPKRDFRALSLKNAVKVAEWADVPVTVGETTEDRPAEDSHDRIRRELASAVLEAMTRTRSDPATVQEDCGLSSGTLYRILNPSADKFSLALPIVFRVAAWAEVPVTVGAPALEPR